MRHSKTQVTILTSLLSGVLLVCGSTSVHASDAVSSKALSMGESRPVDAKKFKFTIEPTKKEYRVKEPIRLKVRGEQDYYLYMWNIGEDGTETLLFPNKKQRKNHFAGGQGYVIPGLDSQPLFGDKPGKEKLRVVASARKVDLDYSGLNSEGDYYTGDAKSFKQQFGTKDIVWGGATATGDAEAQSSGRDSASKTLVIKIGASDQVLLHTDRREYDVGDTIRIYYESPVNGIVTLAYKYEDGTRQILKRSKVDAGKVNVLEADAEAPGGKHTLLAWVSSRSVENDMGADDYYDEVDSSSSGKDLHLGVAATSDEKSSRKVASYVILVKE